ncbi:hypothetical protein PV08_08427 [Exophiala spinifera]|uniref:EGF-like domain-containing protein n=1 Tax=Exophiala spinifera TaxID=91928 RepID=A0A0D2B3K0_9EURO|nr:uncharacterized protein PV08_08427 [Exophiala spinifera]KIW13240.1 hypothetical protein PV08_08427 [Exophiala spinifera]
MSHGRPPSQPNRFHYPQYANQQQTQPAAGYAHPSQYQQTQQEFPPHPSVRLPPNAKLNARQQLGVGVSPPPARFAGPQRPSQRPGGSGVLVQDFKFPTAPPVPESSPGKAKQDASPSPGRRSNVHESYMSSVLDDFATPGTTPGSRSRGFPTPKRYSGSVYAESEALGVDERYDQGIATQNSSRSTSPENSPQIVRQASLGKRAKPAMTTIKNRNSHLSHEIPEEGADHLNPTNRTAAMNALSAAVAAGITAKPPHFQPASSESRSYTPVRMPFDTSPPASPSADREYLQTPKSLSTVTTTKLFEGPPGSSHSRKSTNPLLGLGIEQPSMSDKIPPNRRPPRLDMDAVKEAEQRGSTTSLSDLIRRATRLAANLDRGKTASRLGMLDMWGSSDKLSNNRQSTMSDMISAFPAPAVGGTPTRGKDGAWPLTEKGEVYDSTTDLTKDPSRKQRRKCCGLTLPVFFAILVVLIVLIAAAVLIPIFLIIVPKQNSKDHSCASSHPCANGGTSISSQDTCVCVCSNGFTGSQCETPGDVQDCTIATVTEGSNQYRNATLGSSVMPSLLQAQNQFNISLNSSTILSLFSTNNLSCTSENSLMDFNSTSQSTKTRRFIIIPGLEPQSNRLASIDEGLSPPVVSKRAEAIGGSRFRRRDDGVTVGTSNGIVFQATSATIVGAVPTPSASKESDVSTVTSVTESSSPTSTAASGSESGSPSSTSNRSAPKPTSTLTEKDINFARVVVLFVLQQSRTLDVAVNAQQKMEDFFQQQQTQGNSSTKVDVGEGNQRFSADFDAFSITLGNGLVVGGKTTN